MGREVRMVPSNWQHPTYWAKNWRTGKPELRFKPMHKSSYAERVAEWDEAASKWEAGLFEDYSSFPTVTWKPKDADDTGSYTEYAGDRPKEDEYMPVFPEGTATHLMMYENTSEGTPISPAFATPEELARWLADNQASAFGGDGADYEHWLAVAKNGWAPSMVIANGRMMSGVEAMAELKSS